MDILQSILDIAKKNKVQFLVIGGHAINAIGYARQTADLDLLVSKSNREFWCCTLKSFRYEQLQDHEVFARFKSLDLAAWPINLMFVEQNVFEQLLYSATLVNFGNCQVYIPSLKHMIALKLHALKQRQEHREARDIIDIQELLKIESLPTHELRQLCQKYDRLDLYEQFERFCT